MKKTMKVNIKMQEKNVKKWSFQLSKFESGRNCDLIGKYFNDDKQRTCYKEACCSPVAKEVGVGV